MSSVEIRPETLQQFDGRWFLNNDMARPGGGMFAIVADFCGHCRVLKDNVQRAQRNRPFDFFFLESVNEMKRLNKRV